MPEDTIRYVEVPQIQEVIRHVPKREVVEVEKRVPRYEIDYVERLVDVPQVQYVDKYVDVPQYQEVVKYVPIHQVVDVPKEIIKTVPRLETRVIEKVVEVPGEIIEVPKPYTVENKVAVPQYTDKQVPLVVAQTVRPVVTETQEEVEIEVMEWEPEIIQVEVQVPKPVPAHLVASGLIEQVHRTVDVPNAHFNSLLKALNPHISDVQMGVLPYLRTEHGQVQFLNPTDRLQYIQPDEQVVIEGLPTYPQQYGAPPSVNQYAPASQFGAPGSVNKQPIQQLSRGMPPPSNYQPSSRAATPVGSRVGSVAQSRGVPTPPAVWAANQDTRSQPQPPLS
eukprot:GHVO01011834.1.p1 GENE.GHVO01011834.1~~GHVO01011834.1.p1  ORF type:complete len:344 (-),score=62.00 GHVO01011834.1:116-1120(-)